MQYTANRGEKGRVEIKVDVPKAAFDEAYDTVLKNFAKDAKISGFRPGNAPLDLVEGNVGANKVLNETASFLVSRHLSEILQKENLSPIDQPKLAFDSLTKGAPFSFTVTFIQMPKVTVGDWKKVKVKKAEVQKVSGENIDKSIENIFNAWREQKGKEGLEDKEGQEGQEVQEGPEGEEQGKFIYDAKGNKLPLDGSLRSSPSQDLAAGLKISHEEVKPDDDFAKAIGAKDLTHLRELVRRDLEALVTDQAEIKFENEIFEEIRKLSELEVPEIMVDDEVNRMLVNLAQQLEREGRGVKDWIEEQKTTLDALKAKWRESAERNVKTTLTINQIGKEEKVQVPKEEVDKVIANMSEKNLSAEQKRDLERYVTFNMFTAKTIDLIKKTISA
ncbi:hypothetical protein HY382_02135 [Candidatus Curtissbacteria bacterium]|nr:hypothetical protein [Candidatus Curtissbacteria bacterium]